MIGDGGGVGDWSQKGQGYCRGRILSGEKRKGIGEGEWIWRSF